MGLIATIDFLRLEAGVPAPQGGAGTPRELLARGGSRKVRHGVVETTRELVDAQLTVLGGLVLDLSGVFLVHGSAFRFVDVALCDVAKESRALLSACDRSDTRRTSSVRSPLAAAAVD